MTRLVLKFGGTSVADPARIEEAAAKVAEEVARGHQVAVVVSAMAGVTNELVEYCRTISPLHDPREYDAVVASGENITAGLMAMALQKRGIKARSWQGWQASVLCDEVHGKARIVRIGTEALEESLAAGDLPVIAGFQGVTAGGRIATLGRGGSDTSAVALAASLKADRCDIYTDVNGVYTTDPRIVPQARKLARISYEEMLEMASLGAKVLQTRSVEMAMKWNVPVQVLSSFESPVGSDLPGTLVTREDDIVEQEIVNGIAYSRDEARITLIGLPDIPGVAARIFGPLAEAAINVDMIVQNASRDGKLANITFTVMHSDLPRAINVLKKCSDLENADIRTDEDVVKISIVGIGMRSHAGVAQTMFKTLAEKGVNIQVISTSEIKISVLVAAEYTELAIRALHAAYGLETGKKLA